MILVDSSVFIDLLRQRHYPEVALARWLLAGELATCGIVRMEVMRGALHKTLKERLAQLFDVMLEVPLTSRLLHDATEMAWSLDRAGRVLPISDLVISRCALQIDATLVSGDEHFRHVPGLKWRKHLPAA